MGTHFNLPEEYWQGPIHRNVPHPALPSMAWEIPDNAAISYDFDFRTKSQPLQHGIITEDRATTALGSAVDGDNNSDDEVVEERPVAERIQEDLKANWEGG